MSNFQNLSDDDKQVFILITQKTKAYKDGLKKFFSIAENQREFDEFAEDFYKSIFFSYLDDKEKD